MCFTICTILQTALFYWPPKLVLSLGLTRRVDKSLHFLFAREAKYAKNHFQQNRYSLFEGHVMRKESIRTKIFRAHGNREVVWGLVR